MKRFFLLPWQSISSRLAIWYALAATITLTCLFVTGYFALQNHVISGLDRLNLSELGQVKAHLVREFSPDDPGFLEKRLRKPTDRTGGLFYIHLKNDVNGMQFFSNNLNGQTLFDPAGKSRFNIALPDVGSLRVGSYKVEPYTITIGTSDRDGVQTLEAYAQMGLVLLGAMMLASIGIGYGLSRLALRPVRMISETAHRIRSDNLSERIAVGTVRDEIFDLSVMLNQMFDRLESAFNEIPQFSADASHELKTPFSLVRLYAEKLLLAGDLKPEQEEMLQMQLEELERLDQIIEEMLFLSRAEASAITLVLNRVNPARFLRDFSVDASVLAEHQGIHFFTTHDGEGRVAFDEERMRQVLLNLLSNALKASPTGGKITLRSTLDNEKWRISVEDEGQGLPVSQQERIFERFVRFPSPDRVDKGHGLGLSICRSIINLHRGRIIATSASTGSGLCFIIELPAGGKI